MKFSACAPSAHTSFAGAKRRHTVAVNAVPDDKAQNIASGSPIAPPIVNPAHCCTPTTLCGNFPLARTTALHSTFAPNKSPPSYPSKKILPIDIAQYNFVCFNFSSVSILHAGPYRSLAECATCKLGPVYSNMRMSLLFVSQSEDARRPSHLTFAPLPWLGLSLQQAASLLSPRSLSLSLSLPTLFVVCAAGYGSDSRCDSNRRCGGDRRGGDGTRRALSTVSHAPLP